MAQEQQREDGHAMIRVIQEKIHAIGRASPQLDPEQAGVPPAGPQRSEGKLNNPNVCSV